MSGHCLYLSGHVRLCLVYSWSLYIIILQQQQDMTVLLEKQIEELQKENVSIAGALKESTSLRESNFISIHLISSQSV